MGGVELGRDRQHLAYLQVGVAGQAVGVSNLIPQAAVAVGGQRDRLQGVAALHRILPRRCRRVAVGHRLIGQVEVVDADVVRIAIAVSRLHLIDAHVAIDHQLLEDVALLRLLQSVAGDVVDEAAVVGAVGAVAYRHQITVDVVALAGDAAGLVARGRVGGHARDRAFLVAVVQGFAEGVVGADVALRQLFAGDVAGAVVAGIQHVVVAAAVGFVDHVLALQVALGVVGADRAGGAAQVGVAAHQRGDVSARQAATRTALQFPRGAVVESRIEHDGLTDAQRFPGIGPLGGVDRISRLVGADLHLLYTGLHFTVGAGGDLGQPVHLVVAIPLRADAGLRRVTGQYGDAADHIAGLIRGINLVFRRDLRAPAGIADAVAVEVVAQDMALTAVDVGQVVDVAIGGAIHEDLPVHHVVGRPQVLCVTDDVGDDVAADDFIGIHRRPRFIGAGLHVAVVIHRGIGFGVVGDVHLQLVAHLVVDGGRAHAVHGVDLGQAA